MAIVFSNNARTTLASNISNSATTITVADGSVFPSLTGSDIFYCTIDDGTNNEIVKVTAISSNTLTVVRGQDNTSANAFVSGDLVELRLVAAVLDTFSQVDAGEVTADEFIGDLRGAVIFKAEAGEAVSKGDVVYVSGISGNTPVVALADADFTSKMPAFGLVLTAASANGSTEVVTFGTISGLDTSSFSVGDTLYVSTTAGALTNSKPTGEASLIQNIGMVQRSHATAGSVKVGGAGRTATTPNLNDGNIFIGNASNQATTASLNTKIEDYLDGGTSTPSFATISSGAITSSGDLTITGNVAINSDDFVVSSSNSRVGINVGTPLATLDIDGDVYVRTGHTLFTDILRPYATTTLTIGQTTNDIAKFTGSIKIGNSTIVDSSRNLTNIGTISSGVITSTGTKDSTNFILQAPLHTVGGGSLADYNEILFDNSYLTGTTGQVYIRHLANSHNDSEGAIAFGTTSTSGTTSEALRIRGDNSATFAGTISSGAITSSDISNFQRDLRSAGQIRATGWYGDTASTDYTGMALEIGVAGSVPHILAYNRGTQSYGQLKVYAAGMSFFAQDNDITFDDTLNIADSSSTSRLEISGTTIVDSSRNLTNIGTISSGAITSTGASSFGTTTITGDLTVDDKLTIGDATANSNSFIEFGERIAATETNRPFIGQTNSGNGVSQDLGLGANSSSGTVKIFAGNVTKFSESAVRLKVANTYIDFTEPLQMGGTEFLSDTLALSNIASISSGNITTTGYLRGPSTFTIDPATHGDDTGTVVIAGNLQVDGTTTTVNSTTVNVSDKAITLGYDATTDAANNQAGIVVYRPETSNAQFLWSETNERFEINRKLNISQHFTVDASGTNDTMVEIGAGTASNHYAYIDLIGDSTYSDYGLRIIRNNGGANTSSFIYHRGTGNFNIETQDGAAIRLRTGGLTALTLDSSQNANFTGDVTANGYLQHYSFLYSRNSLKVLNAAGTGWHDWATRGGGKFDLDVNNIVASGTLSSGSISSSGTGTFVGDGAVGPNALNLLASTNGNGVGITFTDNGSPPAANTGQRGQLLYYHGDGASYGSGNAFVLTGTESTATILADGKLMFKEGLYLKPSSGTGAGTEIIDSSGNISQGISNKTHGGYVYGRNIGMSDQMDLFAISDFDDDKSLRRKFERGDTDTSWTKVDDSDAPASGVFDVDSNQSITWGPYIPIDDDTEIIFETWMKHVSGTDTSGNFYAGSQFYDGSKTSLGNNTRYWGSGGDAQDADNTSWRHIKGVMRGDAIRSQSATSTAKYMRFLVLFNYNATGNKTRFCGFRFYRSKLTVSSLYLKPNVSTSFYQDSNPQTLESDTAPVVIDGSRRHYGNNTATNTTPQFTFAGDPDTGLGYIGSDSVGLIAGASRKFYVNNTTAYFQNLSGGVDIDGTISSGAHTITSTGTIGTTTPGNGYLQVTDGTNTLALDPNEIYSNNSLVITTGGDFDIRNGSFSMGAQVVITSSKNIINVGDITASGLITGDRFLSGLGTAASPAYKVGDGDSGFYDSGANFIGVSLGGALEYEFKPTELDLKTNALKTGAITVEGNLLDDQTMINIVQTNTAADIATQESFIDFTFIDSNANNYPQVKIGAQVGQNADADSQLKEGSGAFVVHTNNATTADAGGQSGMAERMRVDYQGHLGLGTNSPAIRLHTYHPTTNVVARFESGDSQVYIDLHDSNSGTYGALLGHSSTKLFHVADASVADRLVLDNSGNLSVTGDVTAAGNMYINTANDGLYFSGGNNRIYFTNNRALEGDTGGTNLQVGEGYTNILAQGNLDVSGNITADSSNTTLTGGSTDGSGNAFVVNRGGNSQEQALRVENSGEVVVSNSYLYASYSGTAFYSQGLAIFRGGISNDSGSLALNDNVVINGDLTVQSTASVGITINADTDNVTEADVPYLSFKMDGTGERLRMGVDSANEPYISTDSDIGLPLNIKTGTSDQLAMSFSASQNIGIPNGYLLIGADSGDAFNASSNIRLQNSNHNYIQIKTPTNKQAGVLIGDTDDDFVGGFIYSNVSDELWLYSDNAVALTLDSSQNAIFAGTVDATALKADDSGTTPAACKLHVGTLNSAGSSAVAQFGGFVRAAQHLIVHSAAGSSDAVFMSYTSGDIDFRTGEGSGATPAAMVNSLKVGTSTVITSASAVQNITSISMTGNLYMNKSQPWVIISNTTEDGGGVVFTDNQADSAGTGGPGSSSQAFRMTYHCGNETLIMGHDDDSYAGFNFGKGGALTCSGNVTAFSDERLKDNIKTLDGKKALQMRGVSFTKDGKEGSGVIAQELEKVAPELVTTDKVDGIKSVAYGNLVGYLIEAIKDQQKEIEYMKSEIKTLKENNNGN